MRRHILGCVFALVIASQAQAQGDPVGTVQSVDAINDRNGRMTVSYPDGPTVTYKVTYLTAIYYFDLPGYRLSQIQPGWPCVVHTFNGGVIAQRIILFPQPPIP